MSYLSLYRQWRPQTFEDIVGQDHIVRTLKNAIANGRVVHAYMFSGPRGTGKTSTAKVFAKALNCAEGPTVKPCGECTSCVAVKEGNALDVIEIDAASNRGIDEIRDLRDKVRFTPAQGRYKVYIIDEVHMLTMEAFNALLKTLEEPPSHAIFVLATTEANRVPATILSRCQRFDFNRLNLAQLTKHLTKVADQMGIAYEKDALTLLARKAEGSARDALGLMEQVSALGEKLTPKLISDMLGATEFERLEVIAAAIASSDVRGLFPLVSDTLMSGTDPRQLLGEMGEHFMDLMLAKDCPARKDLLHSGEERFDQLKKASEAFEGSRLQEIVSSIGVGLAEIGKAPNPRLSLELFLARLVNAGQGVKAQPVAAAEAAPSRHAVPVPKAPAAAPAVKAEGKKEAADAGKKETAAQAAPVAEKAAEGQQKTEAPAFWGQLLDELRLRSIRVEALVRQSRPSFDGTTLTLEYPSNWFFHHQKMQEETNQNLMKEVLKAVTGTEIGYKCVLLGDGDKDRPEKEKPAESKDKPSRVAPRKSKKSKIEEAEKGGEAAFDEIEIEDEKVKKSVEMAKALFGEVEIKVVED